MKKLLTLLLVFVLGLGLVACGGEKSNKETGEKSESTVESGEAVLTVDNIYDYLSFNVRLENVMRFATANSSSAAGGAVEVSRGASGFAGADIVLETFAKKPVYFDSVVIEYSFVAEEENVPAIEGRSLQLKYDGEMTETFKYRPEEGIEMEGNPTYKVVVTKVSGKAVPMNMGVQTQGAPIASEEKQSAVGETVVEKQEDIQQSVTVDKVETAAVE